MEKKQDKFKNNFYILTTTKAYEVQARETKNQSLIMVIIPKTEAGLLNYANQIFIGKFFDYKIKFLGIEFTLDPEKMEFTSKPIEPKAKDEKNDKEEIDPDIDVPFWPRIMYKIRAFNEHVSFFLKNGYNDITYKHKRQALEFIGSIQGLYEFFYNLKLEVVP